VSRKKAKGLHQWLIPKLRRISMFWPQKAIARKKSKHIIEVGKFKNGRPKLKTMYECAMCGPDYLYEKEETHMDHIVPVVDLSGFTNWDDYINGLFAPVENYQTLCIPHHEEKSKAENKKRLTLSKNYAKMNSKYNYKRKYKRSVRKKRARSN
jgi:5-methylcytosine-specific restriction endonuclease McrA